MLAEDGYTDGPPRAADELVKRHRVAIELGGERGAELATAQ